MDLNLPKKRYFPLWWFLKGLSLLPFPVLYLFSDMLCFLVYRVLGYRKKVVWQNLKNSFPEKSDADLNEIKAAFYHNLCDIIVETIKLASLKNEDLNDRVTIINGDLLNNFTQAGITVVSLGSHLANWEWALPAAAIKFKAPMHGVYKPLINDFFDWYLINLRTKSGGMLIKMKDTMRHFIRNRKNAVGVTMLADQTPPGGEIQYWATFLNQDTPFYVGGEKLANAFNLPLIFFGARRIKRGYYEFELELLHDGKAAMPPGEFPLTELYARKLEKWIQAYPADYLWSHKRWKHKRQQVTDVPESATKQP